MTAATPPPPAAHRLRRRIARIGPGMPRLGSGITRMRPLDDGGRAPAVAHLEELRWRLVAYIGALVVGFAAAYLLRHHLFALLNAPLGGDYRVQTLSVTEPFFTGVTVAANAAFVLTMPVLVFNCYRYVSPALTPLQRRGVRPLVVVSPLLFGVGVAFCYLFVLGPAVRFLLGLGEGSFDVTVRAQEYYSFVSMTLLCMGLVFEFPLVLLGLGRLGVVTAAMLRANRRVAFVVVAIAAALLPTADPVSLVIEMLPLLALFELSILLVALQERSGKRSTAVVP